MIETASVLAQYAGVALIALIAIITLARIASRNNPTW
jgi:hypothetical protein